MQNMLVTSKYLWIHLLDQSAYFVPFIFTKLINAFFFKFAIFG